MIVINMDFWLMYRVSVSIMFFLVKIAFKMLMGIEATFRYLCKSKKEVCLGLSWQYFDLKFTSSNKVTIIFVSDTTCHTPIYSSLCPWRDFLASWISRLAFPVTWNQNSLRKRAPRKSCFSCQLCGLTMRPWGHRTSSAASCSWPQKRFASFNLIF